MTGPALVLAFPDIGIEHRAAVGGKAAGLGELTRAGFAVPEGCVLTTRAFAAALHRIDPEGSIATRLAALTRRLRDARPRPASSGEDHPRAGR